MPTFPKTLSLAVRVLGALQVLLGVLFWAGIATGLLLAHIVLGLLLVVALWVMAFLGARAGVSARFVALGAVWGIIVLVFGMTQTQILQGGLHWTIRVLHLLVGLALIGQVENLARRIRDANEGRRAARAATPA